MPVPAELAWQLRVAGVPPGAGAGTTKVGVRLHAKPVPGATLATRFVVPV